jgi:hypothetical protein
LLSHAVARAIILAVADVSTMLLDMRCVTTNNFR